MAAEVVAAPRIIGGLYRGRKLLYSGDERTRPMKDRVREAVFNLLGPGVRGMHAVDLFAGTGALGLEALSRGAAHATFFERHFPTAGLIRDNAVALGVVGDCTIVPANTFVQVRRELPWWPSREQAAAWLVFCSPPYDFYVDRAAEMRALFDALTTAAPAGSILVVEADERFNMRSLPEPDLWDVRGYPPAFVALRRWPLSPASDDHGYL